MSSIVSIWINCYEELCGYKKSSQEDMTTERWKSNSYKTYLVFKDVNKSKYDELINEYSKLLTQIVLYKRLYFIHLFFKHVCFNFTGLSFHERIMV